MTQVNIKKKGSCTDRRQVTNINKAVKNDDICANRL